MIEIKFKKLIPEAEIPTVANKGDIGWDVVAPLRTLLRPLKTTKVRTGFAVSIPPGYEIQVRGRSGKALKHELTISQGIGTIDSGYRGEVCILIRNNSLASYMVEPGDKIAQLVIKKQYDVVWKEVDELDETERGESGFGSSDSNS